MIFWQYLKGLERNNNNDYMTIINWSNYVTASTITSYDKFRSTPTLTYNGTDLGHILSSQARAQFYGVWCHDEIRTAGNIIWTGSNTSSANNCYLYLGSHDIGDMDTGDSLNYLANNYFIEMDDTSATHDLKYRSRNNNGTVDALCLNGGILYAGGFQYGGTDYWHFQTIEDGAVVRSESVDHATVTFWNNSGAAHITSVTGEINLSWGPADSRWANRTNTPIKFTSNGLIQGAYFNATSDRRAKTDIEYLQKPVLNLVKQTPICTFTYKDSNTSSLGILAQDLQDVDLNGVSLVDNRQATGENGDYMTIRESKLVYVLWKAVQEQQKQIEHLQFQLSQLKKD